MEGAWPVWAVVLAALLGSGLAIIFAVACIYFFAREVDVEQHLRRNHPDVHRQHYRIPQPNPFRGIVAFSLFRSDVPLKDEELTRKVQANVRAYLLYIAVFGLVVATLFFLPALVRWTT